MGQGPCTLAFGASRTFAYRERESTERVNIVRELRKESFEEREERAREKKKRVVKEKRERKSEEQRKR